METIKHYVNSVGRCQCDQCIFLSTEKIKYPNGRWKHIVNPKKENQKSFICDVCHKRLIWVQVLLEKCQGEI
ncbi:hypothetical protein LT336_00747 [Spiroplasma sp. JKS002671]|nr:hypothetical protein [Spiroplasma sp. JKS002671]MCL8210995.1 hypothetical protein [Spiroplasma sp. JKS002671]